jgi:hypothetical protein
MFTMMQMTIFEIGISEYGLGQVDPVEKGPGRHSFGLGDCQDARNHKSRDWNEYS